MFAIFLMAFMTVCIPGPIWPTPGPMGAVEGRDYPPEVSGTIEQGKKLFDYDPFAREWEDEVPDSYSYWRALIRYQQRLKPYSYYYLRYEFLDRDYTIREQFSSRLHDVTGNLTYQLSEAWRYRIQLSYRRRDYPHAPTRTYHALTPSLQLNHNVSDDTVCSGLYRVQRRVYPRGGGDYDHHGMTLTLRHDLNPRLRLEGRFRVDYRDFHSPDREGNFERRAALGFRYVAE